MKASILLTTYKHTDILEANLSSIAKQNLPKEEFEVILLDEFINNEETKFLVNRLKEKLNIKYYNTGSKKTDHNTWRIPGFAINYAVKNLISDSKYLIIGGADIYHFDNTVKSIVNALDNDSMSLAITNGFIDNDSFLTKNILNNTKKIFDVNSFLRFKGVEKLNTELPFFMGMLKNNFLKINGFDEDFIGIAFDDNDLIDRLKSIGCKIKYTDSNILHMYHKKEYAKNNEFNTMLEYNARLYKQRSNNPIRNNYGWGDNNMWFLKNIPKIVHLYWGDKNNFLPLSRFLSILSIRKLNKDWKIKLHLPKYKGESNPTWNTGEQNIIESFVDTNNYFDELKNLNVDMIYHDFNNCGFTNNAHEVHKSDFLRWIVLFEDGGIWSDIDLIYSKSFSEIYFNNQKNREINTGLFIYPNTKSHGIGFLLSSKDNPIFMECHRIAARNYVEKKYQHKYQSLGSEILNEYFQKNTVYEMVGKNNAIFFDKELVYSVDYNNIPSFFKEKNIILDKKTIGFHWYAGNILSRNFEKNLTIDDIFLKNNFLNNYIKINLKKELLEIKANIEDKKKINNKLNFLSIKENEKLEWNLKDIPKIANFYWGGKNFPFLRYVSLMSFKKQNPNWTVNLYTPKIISDEMPWNKKQFEQKYEEKFNYFNKIKDVNIIEFDFKEIGISNNINEIHKSDFIRYYLLKENGGIWSDMDIFYFKPINYLFENNKDNIDKNTFLYFGTENNEIGGHAIGFLMSSKGNVYFENIFNLAKENYKKQDYQSIGADLLNKQFDSNYLNKNCKNITLMKKSGVYAIDHMKKEFIYEKTNNSFFDSNSIGIHWYGGSESVEYLMLNINHLNYKDIKNNGTLINLIRNFWNE